MARCSSTGNWSSGGNTSPSACSARAINARKAGLNSSFGFKWLSGVGIIGVEQQANAQLGLVQGLLAMPVQADATLEGAQRFVQTHVAALHASHQLLEFVERMFEISDRRSFNGSGSGLGHGRQR